VGLITETKLGILLYRSVKVRECLQYPEQTAFISSTRWHKTDQNR